MKYQAQTAIQCDCPNTGKTGTFLFEGDSHRIKDTRISPVFADLAALYPWLRENGWNSTVGHCGTAYELDAATRNRATLTIIKGEKTRAFNPEKNPASSRACRATPTKGTRSGSSSPRTRYTAWQNENCCPRKCLP